MENSVLPAQGFVRLSTILNIIPVSEATWWRGVKSGRFPPGKKLGPKIRFWRAEDIRELIEKIDQQSMDMSEAENES